MAKQNGCFLGDVGIEWFCVPSSRDSALGHFVAQNRYMYLAKAIASLPINVLSIIVKCIYYRWRVLPSSDDLHFVGDTGINFA